MSSLSSTQEGRGGDIHEFWREHFVKVVKVGGVFAQVGESGDRLDEIQELVEPREAYFLVQDRIDHVLHRQSAERRDMDE